MDSIRYYLLAILFVFSCNEKEELYNIVSKSNLIDEKLKFYIEKYIGDNNIDPPCMINVQLIKYQYNYTAFNISTDFSRDLKYSKECYKSKNGVDICFYSGIENYIIQDDNRISNISKSCINAKMIVVIDSAKVWTSFDNIGLFPLCELPDIRDLLSKANHKE